MSSTFAWHDLFTKDRQSSMEFYSALFGYTFEEEENRAIFSNQDGPQGALIDMDSSLGLPTHWLPYISVPSTTDAAFRIGAGGGRLIMSGNSFLIFTDVEGALLKIFQGNMAHSVDSQCPGSIVFDELLCTNSKQALAFIQNITGWHSTTTQLWPTGEYHFCTEKDSDVAIAGIRTVNPKTVPSSFWVSHFKTDNLKAALGKVLDFGGAIVTPFLHLPGYGLSAIVQDNMGATFALLE